LLTKAALEPLFNARKSTKMLKTIADEGIVGELTTNEDETWVVPEPISLGQG